MTILWHYENLTPPRDWSGLYAELVKSAQADDAWVTTAGAVVEWFKDRRRVKISCKNERDRLTISAEGGPPPGSVPPLMVRIHNPNNRQISVNTESDPRREYIDIKLNMKTITVLFS